MHFYSLSQKLALFDLYHFSKRKYFAHKITRYFIVKVYHRHKRVKYSVRQLTVILKLTESSNWWEDEGKKESIMCDYVLDLFYIDDITANSSVTMVGELLKCPQPCLNK